MPIEAQGLWVLRSRAFFVIAPLELDVKYGFNAISSCEGGDKVEWTPAAKFIFLGVAGLDLQVGTRFWF